MRDLNVLLTPALCAVLTACAIDVKGDLPEHADAFATLGTGKLTGWSLVDADSDRVVRTLADDDKLYLGDLGVKNFNIVAKTSITTVGPVKVTLTGAVSKSRVEQVPPYAVFGDDPATGDYFGRQLLKGSYEAKAYLSNATSAISFNVYSGTAPTPTPTPEPTPTSRSSIS